MNNREIETMRGEIETVGQRTRRNVEAICAFKEVLDSTLNKSKASRRPGNR
jgi:hypothetical protein